jgi:hypothetical protein
MFVSYVYMGVLIEFRKLECSSRSYTCIQVVNTLLSKYGRQMCTRETTLCKTFVID